MKNLLSAVLSALGKKETVVFCTVLKSSGSTPRGAGAHMAVFADGHTEGTVGGGAVELSVTKLAAQVRAEGVDRIKEYRLTPGETADLGMVCGGDVTVLLQVLSQDEIPVLRALKDAVQGRETVWLLMQLQGEKVAQLGFRRGRHEAEYIRADDTLPDSLCCAHPVLREDGWYAEPVHSGAMVYVFGAGHVSRALVPILKSVDFTVTVYDPRMKLASRSWFPQADDILCGDFHEIGKRVQVTEEDYIVIMTPGHEADREVLAQALRTPATYVGCIGSRRKIAATKEFLAREGFGEADWARVHAPIGLPIGGRTPAEIAVSITAELIAHRAGLQGEKQ